MCNAAVHIYLCDDSPKDFKERYNGQTFLTVALRQQMIDALYQVHGVPVIRVTRVKGKGETNPKSANLNNCLKQIYGDAIPPTSEVVGVFDADQAAHSHFFTSTLPWMDAGDDVALVQSPQVGSPLIRENRIVHLVRVILGKPDVKSGCPNPLTRPQPGSAVSSSSGSCGSEDQPIQLL